MDLCGLWYCGMDDLFVWFWLWILGCCKGSRERVEAVLLVLWNFQTNFCFPKLISFSSLGSHPPPLQIPLLLTSIVLQVGVFLSLFLCWLDPCSLDIQRPERWTCCRFSFLTYKISEEKKVYCLSYLMTHQDLFICDALSIQSLKEEAISAHQMLSTFSSVKIKKKKVKSVLPYENDFSI